MEIIAQLIINSIIAGSIYALIALGFNLIYSVTKFFNITHGVVAVIGAYGVYFFYTVSGYNLYLSILAAVALAGIAGMLTDRLIFSRLRMKNASAITMFVASLGLFTVLQAVVAMLFSNQFRILTETFASRKSYSDLICNLSELDMVDKGPPWYPWCRQTRDYGLCIFIKYSFSCVDTDLLRGNLLLLPVDSRLILWQGVKGNP